MERVDPNWVMENVPSHAARPASESPGLPGHSRHTVRGMAIDSIVMHKSADTLYPSARASRPSALLTSTLAP
jgi:hypothetical protein